MLAGSESACGGEPAGDCDSRLQSAGRGSGARRDGYGKDSGNCRDALTELIKIGRPQFPGHVRVVAKRDADGQCLAGIVTEWRAHQAKEALGDGTPGAKEQQSEYDLRRDEKSMSEIAAQAGSHRTGAGKQDAISFGAGEPNCGRQPEE